MAKFKDLIIQELGETTDAYDWRQVRESEQMYEYQFYADDLRYEVYIETFMPGYLSVEFAPDPSQDLDKRPGETRYTMTTEAGSPFRIMATVVQIARHAWENRETFEWSDGLEGFAFTASERKRGRREGPNVREKLYKKFIRKQFPDAQIMQGPGDIVQVKIKD